MSKAELLLHLVFLRLLAGLRLAPALGDHLLHIVVSVLIHVFHHVHDSAHRISLIRLGCGLITNQRLLGLQISPVLSFVFLEQSDGDGVRLDVKFALDSVNLILELWDLESQVLPVKSLNSKVKALVLESTGHLVFWQLADTIQARGDVDLDFSALLVPAELGYRLKDGLIRCCKRLGNGIHLLWLYFNFLGFASLSHLKGDQLGLTLVNPALQDFLHISSSGLV